MYIGYDVKGGIRYAKLCVSERVDGKVRTTQKSLGRVLDEGKHIYQSRERGVFTYDLATGEYGKPDPSDIPSVRRRNHRESLILDFGDAYLIDKVIDGFGLYKATDAMDYGNNDSVRAMLMFYILSQSANCYAQDWYDGSYARILFPKANLESQRISDILSAIGDEWSYREFFKEYLPLVANAGKDGEDVLIDSTGLPNSIHFPLTAVSNHNGEISNEVRLIYVVQKKDEPPPLLPLCPRERGRRLHAHQDDKGAEVIQHRHKVRDAGRRIPHRYEHEGALRRQGVVRLQAQGEQEDIQDGGGTRVP
jgi:hypothetical protein